MVYTVHDKVHHSSGDISGESKCNSASKWCSDSRSGICLLYPVALRLATAASVEAIRNADDCTYLVLSTGRVLLLLENGLRTVDTAQTILLKNGNIDRMFSSTFA